MGSLYSTNSLSLPLNVFFFNVSLPDGESRWSVSCGASWLFLVYHVHVLDAFCTMMENLVLYPAINRPYRHLDALINHSIQSLQCLGGPQIHLYHSFDCLLLHKNPHSAWGSCHCFGVTTLVLSSCNISHAVVWEILFCCRMRSCREQ